MEYFESIKFCIIKSLDLPQMPGQKLEISLQPSGNKPICLEDHFFNSLILTQTHLPQLYFISLEMVFLMLLEC